MLHLQRGLDASALIFLDLALEVFYVLLSTGARAALVVADANCGWGLVLVLFLKDVSFCCDVWMLALRELASWKRLD